MTSGSGVQNVCDAEGPVGSSRRRGQEVIVSLFPGTFAVEQANEPETRRDRVTLVLLVLFSVACVAVALMISQ